MAKISLVIPDVELAAIIACQQVRVLDKSCAVGAKVGDVPLEIMAAVSLGLKAILDLA